MNLVYLYKDGNTKTEYVPNIDSKTKLLAYGPNHWSTILNCYIFTVDKYNEEVLNCKTKLF